MAEVLLQPAWRLDDPKLAAETLALWQRLDAMPPHVAEDRVKELCAVAYRDGELVGVSTVVLDHLPQLGYRFGLFRCLVDPAYRQQGLARNLTVYSRDSLAGWSKDHPEEAVVGMAAVVESPKLDELGKQPVWPASGLTLMGYTQNDLQIRIVWFEHAALGLRRLPAARIEAEQAKIVTVWRKNDTAIRTKAMALWNRLGVLPSDTSLEERADQLSAAAFDGDALVGVGTIALAELPQLRRRFGFFRCLVTPEHRQRHLARRLGIHAIQVLGEWSKQNPQEKVLGLAAIVENPKLEETSKLPVWSAPEVKNGLVLIGHTRRGNQIRVSWFEHARLA
jgi:GNAT superfamily N-acetyltransferase